MAATGCESHQDLATPAVAADGMADADRTVWSACTVNCGSRCPVRLQVKDGTLARVLPDNTGDDSIGSQQIRACVRGRSIRHRHLNPDRLKYPMKRVGRRGEGKFERIRWEEAFDTVAAQVKRIVSKYGNESVYINYGTGTIGGTIAQSCLPHPTAVSRLMACYGGYLNFYGDYSAANIEMSAPATFGESVGSNSLADAVNCDLQIMFGNNPLETRMSGGGQTFVTQTAKRRHHHKLIIVDPRYSESVVALGDEWVPVRPGTDAALVAGIAHVLITEKRVDRRFLDTYCLGFDESHLPEGAPENSSYESYILGKGPDHTAKTPEWASHICGYPAAKIVSLARELAAAAPRVHITQGWGPQRQANGENQSRAIFALACMLGAPGIPGGGTGEREVDNQIRIAEIFGKENPVKAAISVYGWTDAIERGPEMTAEKDGVQGKEKLDVPIKMIWQYAGNALVNQHGDTNRTTKLLQDESKCEFIVVIENQMSVSARYADILLPDASTAEQVDIIGQQPAGGLGYVILAQKAVEPLFECKPVYEQMTEIAKRLGIEKEYTEGRTQKEWVKAIIRASRTPECPDFPSWDTLKKNGIWKKNLGALIPLKDFRADPKKHPLSTPSGKIEIYSQVMAEKARTWSFDDPWEGDRITAVPEFVPTWEGALAARSKGAKYRLQVIGHHFKARTHSSYGNVDWLREAHRQTVWINPADAEARGIHHEDEVEIYNDRGRIRLPAKVTPRIAPGVLSVPQGAWYEPRDGVDVGGCVNTLTSWHPTPYAKGNAQHTVLAEIRKA